MADDIEIGDLVETFADFTNPAPARPSTPMPCFSAFVRRTAPW